MIRAGRGMAGCRGASSAGLIVLVTFVWATSAWAEPQEPSRDLTEMSLEALMTLQVASVYGASKYLQKETDAPGLVTIVTAEEIQRYGYRTLADILRSVPGLTVTSDRNYTYLGVRGFGRPGDYNTRVLLLVDGHRLNDNIYDNAPLGTDFPLDVDLIDRVEVIQGPSSSLYGTNAFFAVVSVITKRAPQVANGELSGSVGSYDSYKARGTYGATLANGLEVMLSTSAYSSRGHRSLFYPEFDDPATNNGIARKADDDRALQLYGLASFHGFTLQGLVGAREKRIPTASFGTVFDDARNRTTDTRGYLDLRYEDTLPYEIGLLARLYYDRVEYYGHYIYAAESAGEAPIENRDLGHGEWVGSEVQLSRVLWDRHKVITGVEYQRNLSQDQKNYDRSPYLLNLDDRRSGSLWAVYGQGEFFLLKNLVLNAGLRYDYYYTFGGTTSPRVALIYHPVAGSTLKLLYGEAFRAPNAYELYYSAAGNQANPGLQPETIRRSDQPGDRFRRRGDRLPQRPERHGQGGRGRPRRPPPRRHRRTGELHLPGRARQRNRPGLVQFPSASRQAERHRAPLPGLALPRRRAPVHERAADRPGRRGGGVLGGQRHSLHAEAPLRRQLLGERVQPVRSAVRGPGGGGAPPGRHRPGWPNLPT
ncbi:MAG: hypothetical protein DMD79_03320 [Candidatus Rokuibacteriota bacterium]|nr:MAG: hypothetical protein DMD79_03320 [Candidatus Rokubacteria bacterium]